MIVGYLDLKGVGWDLHSVVGVYGVNTLALVILL